MPGTINGIGTHYYGKKNVLQRPGVCQQCGNHTTLASYDTRLWFVVVFIPVIPLGRKRIIDACPCCRRHYVADLREWQTTRQLEVSGALEKFRSSPTPENAIEAHKQFLKFQQSAEAAELQRTMLEKFPENAKVQLHLGQALAYFGKPQEAEPFFARALELRPDLPEARIGVAESCIRNNQLDRARELLDFLGKPGAAQLYPLGPLERLALAFQRASRHSEALELFAQLIEAVPQVAQDKRFRNVVKQSEKAVGRENSILPKAKFSLGQFFRTNRAAAPGRPYLTWRGLIVVGILGVVMLLGFLVSNEVKRRHRDLYFVNALPTQLDAEVSGFGKVRLHRGLTKITVPEGHYKATIAEGATNEVIEFDISTTYGSRFSEHPVWVVNPGSAAILLQQQVVYSKNPRPGTVNFVFGEPFFTFPNIDYAFKDMPRSVQVPSGGERILSHIDLSSVEPSQVFLYYLENKRTDEAYQFAERRLQLCSSDEKLVEAYAGTSSGQARVQKFLQAGLSNRPVQIEWHRAYQNLLLGTTNGPQLISLYNKLLQDDPTNGALLYLRGRICGDHFESRRYLERARQADPNSPYPLYGLAYEETAQGQWEQAWALLNRVIELHPGDNQMLALWTTASIGAGQPEPVEKLFRTRLQNNPTDLFSVARLCEVLVSENKTNEAEKAVRSFSRALPTGGPNNAELVQTAQEHLYYATGQFAELERTARQKYRGTARAAFFWALVEEGRLDEATDFYTSNKGNNVLDTLALSLAFRLAGKAEQAEHWQAQTVKLLEPGGSDSHQTIALLTGKIPPTGLALRELVWPAGIKALLFADLAVMHPENRSLLCAKARQLNVERTFPWHLIQRATETP